MKSLEILAIFCITSSFLGSVADCRRLPTRAALEEGQWRAASDEEEEDLSDDDDIMNPELPTKTTDDDETNDERIARAGTKRGGAISAAQHGEVNFGMDMNMDPAEFAREYEKNGDGDNRARMASNNERLAGTGRLDEKYRWPKGIVPYRIRKDHFSREDRKMIYAGMKLWEKVTCVKFVRARSPDAKDTGHEHYIWIGNGDGCYTFVGYQNGAINHEVTLTNSDEDGHCMIPETVAHELGHVLGLQHEQTRKDRDSYIQVLFGDIKESDHVQFKHKEGHSRFGTPYDYCSIMHYGPQAFAKDEDDEGKLFAMVPKDLDYISVIGREEKNGISYYDAIIVNSMYKCEVTVPQKPCPGRPCTDKYSASACKKLEEQLKGQSRGKKYVGKYERFQDQE